MRVPWNKTFWHDEWIVGHLFDYPSYREMAEAYNKMFGTDIAATTLGGHVKHDLGINKPRSTGEYLTEEQKRFIEEHYPNHPVKETTRMFNEKFGTNKKKYTMLNYAKRHGLTVREEIVTKSKIDASHAEGTKHPYREVGDLRYDGHIWLMKTEEGWKCAARHVWEKKHGKIPDGYAVIHLDGDNANHDIENLLAVPMKYLGVLQGNGLRSADAAITTAGVLWCRLKELLDD